MTDLGPQFDDDFEGTDTDDLTLDFSGVKVMDFTPIEELGWYLCLISDYDKSNPVGPGRKLPEGTKGTNWEFTIQEGPGGNTKHEGRKLWTNHYHHPKTLGFMKGMFKCLDVFEEEELESSLSLSDRDRAVGELICVKVSKRTYKDKEGNKQEANDTKGFKPASEWGVLKGKGSSSTSSATSLMPGS